VGEPTSETERVLLTALEQRPSDDDTRAVLADWLEEQGRAEDAELVRVFLARKAMHAGAAGVAACSERLAELVSSSSWGGRWIVLREPSLRATMQHVIDPPWTAFEPLRLGRVPGGRGTPDLFVGVESDAGPVLRIDLYGFGGRGEVTTEPGLVLIGYGDRVTCVEPYTRRRCLEIDLERDFRRFHRTAGHLFFTSAERVFRLAPDGTLRWRSERVGSDDVRILGLIGERDSESEVAGEGDWEQWETGDLDARRFRLDLATGEVLE
jgi:uncharacterized protein (TIGR02996 family)